MMPLKLPFLLKATEGKVLYKKSDSFLGIGTHSKENLKGKLFVALKGPRFDGHDFLLEACSKGATGFLIHDKNNLPEELKRHTLIEVPDTLKALQNLAQLWKQKLELKVIAITGTNGKTTTKNLIKTLMPEASLSQKSFNNQFGVPLALLSETKKGAWFIQELGVNQPGEMAPLCKICEPSVVAVTTVGLAHLEGLNSIEEIAKEKKQIYLRNPQAVFIFNRDNPYTEKMFQDLKSECREFFTCSSHKKEVDVFFQIKKNDGQQIEIEGEIKKQKGEVLIPISAGNLENLMIAGAIALSCGISPRQIWERLAHCKTPFGRQSWFKIKKPKVSLLFDAYNANPSSMKTFFETCAIYEKSQKNLRKKFFILGDMKELGKESFQYHEELAEYKILQEAFLIWYIGSQGTGLERALKEKSYSGEWIRTASYAKAPLEYLKEKLGQGDFIGLKASRGIGLEKVLFHLIDKETRKNLHF